MYLRSTRELDVQAIPAALASALTAHAAKNQLLLDGGRCWITRSENPPASGFFGKLLGSRSNSVDPDAWHESLLFLHPTHLLVATTGEKRGTSVLSLPLVQASVTRGSPLAASLGQAQDDGISISGFPGEHGRPGSYFFGLGPEPAASACTQAVEAAIVAAKNPPR